MLKIVIHGSSVLLTLFFALFSREALRTTSPHLSTSKGLLIIDRGFTLPANIEHYWLFAESV